MTYDFAKMKRHGDAVTKASAALEESVASIINCDDDAETKRRTECSSIN
jgi:hypothetical protein